MKKSDVEKMIFKLKDEAVYYYRQGNIKKGKEAEKNMRYFKRLLKDYE